MLRYELDSVSNKRSISHESQDDTKKIIDEMNEHHVKQYEALHRKLIAANNETNQLKKKLLKYEKADPIQVGTTNNSSITNQKMEVKRKEIFHSIIRVISLLILAVRKIEIHFDYSVVQFFPLSSTLIFFFVHRLFYSFLPSLQRSKLEFHL